MDQQERILRAQIAAHSKWAKEPDRQAATAKARASFNDRFERQVDPDGTLAPRERARRAESARKAYFKGLAFKSVRARRKAADYTRQASTAEAELTEGSGGEAA